MRSPNHHSATLLPILMKPMQQSRDEKVAAPSTAPFIDQESYAASAKLMGHYLEKGLLNSKNFPMKKGFLKHFAAWLLKDNLPFTTGETPGIR